jgi:hypothetical protein
MIIVPPPNTRPATIIQAASTARIDPHLTSITEIAGDAPELGPAGARVLLFLRAWNGQHLPGSATHGVMAIRDGYVDLLFDDLENLSDRAEADTASSGLRGSTAGGSTPVTNSVDSSAVDWHFRSMTADSISNPEIRCGAPRDGLRCVASTYLWKEGAR